LPSRTERGVIKKFTIGDNRVVGTIEDSTPQSHRRDIPPITYAVTFGAPVFHEPKVTQDLTGQAARTSPQLEAIRRSSDAMLAKSVEAVQRVVVRGDRAVAIFRDKSWRPLERIGTEWRLAE
jgi:hypothetical protein